MSGISSRVTCTSLRAYSGRLDHRRPLLHFRPEETIELLRIAADRLDAKRGQPFDDIRSPQHLREIDAQLCDDGCRRPRWSEDAVPQTVLVAFDALFVQRRQVRRDARAFAGRDGKATYLSSLHQW